MHDDIYDDKLSRSHHHHFISIKEKKEGIKNTLQRPLEIRGGNQNKGRGGSKSEKTKQKKSYM